MEYEKLVELLILEIPEIAPLYKEELEWLDEKPGPYVVFGDVLNPWLKDQLDSSINVELLKRVFGFFEDMARNDDIKVQEALAFAVLEWLGDDTQRLRKSLIYMGEFTRKMCEEVEASLGRKFPNENRT